MVMLISIFILRLNERSLLNSAISEELTVIKTGFEMFVSSSEHIATRKFCIQS